MTIQNSLGQSTNLPGNPTTTSQAAFDNSTKVATTFYADRTNNFGRALLHVVDQKTSGTDGGTFTNGAWRTRDIQTVRTNEISGASVASNQVTLPAGDYDSMWIAPAHDNAGANPHQSRLQNITAATTLVTGVSASVASNNTSLSMGGGRFTLGATSVIELQHQIQSTQNTNGFGLAGGFGVEIYSQLRIWKIS